MSKPILVVTAQFTAAVEERIAREFSPRRNAGGAPFNREELLQAAEGADAIFVTSADKLDAEFFRRLPNTVKAISTFSVGYEHIDLPAAAGRKIPIGYTPGVLTDATADLTLLLLLGAARRAYEAEQFLRSGNWAKRDSSHLLGWQATGKVLGIFGMGRIGQAVAKRARALGMTIHYSNRNRLPASLEQGAVFHDDPHDLLRVSQFFSLHAPDTVETRRFLNAQTIELLPQGAIVVNAARGRLVDDGALIAALKSGRIAAAGLDVFEREPNIHPEYYKLTNAFLLPHVGSATVETRTAMGMLALDNIAAVLAGKPAPALLKI